MRLVLWDIDGTLLDAHGGGHQAFHDAFERVVGHPPRELAPMSGRTDHEIALDTLARNGVQDVDALWPAYAEALADALTARAGEMRAKGRALPGSHEAIAALAEADGVIQALLTGNIRPNAETKLRTFGLLGQIDLEAGAYGSDDSRRPALVNIARGRAAARYDIDLALGDIVLIGDTPRDVEAGLDGGTRMVAVASGRFSVAQLEEAGAGAVLADLRDTDAVLAAVLATSTAPGP